MAEQSNVCFAYFGTCSVVFSGGKASKLNLIGQRYYKDDTA